MTNANVDDLVCYECGLPGTESSKLLWLEEGKTYVLPYHPSCAYQVAMWEVTEARRCVKDLDALKDMPEKRSRRFLLILLKYAKKAGKVKRIKELIMNANDDESELRESLLRSKEDVDQGEWYTAKGYVKIYEELLMGKG